MLPLLLLAAGQPPDAPAAPSATAMLTGEAVARPELPRPPHAEGQCDLLIGLPTAVRYLHPLRGPFWAEVGAGVYVIIPDVFVGLRCDVPVYRGGRNRFVLRPGVAAHAFVASVFTGGSVAPSLSADVELSWLRVRRDGSVHTVGLRAGVIPTFSNWLPVVPAVGVTVGF